MKMGLLEKLFRHQEKQKYETVSKNGNVGYRANAVSTTSQNAPSEANIRDPNLTPMVDEMKIPVRKPDGSTSFVTYMDSVDNDEYALVVPDGNAYHSRAGCYRNWGPYLGSTFSGWELIRVSDAVANGFHKCELCEAAEYMAWHPEDYVRGYGDADRLDPHVVFGKRGMPVFTFSAPVRNSDLSITDFTKDDEIRDQVNQYGEGKLYKGNTFLCNTFGKFKSYRLGHPNAPIEMHVIGVSTTPKGAVSLRIAVYEKS